MNLIRLILAILGTLGILSIAFGAGFFYGMYAMAKELTLNSDKYPEILKRNAR